MLSGIPKSMTALLVLVTAGVLYVEAVQGQDTHFDSWFRGLASADRLHPNIDQISIEYTIEEQLPKPSKQEIESLRKAIGSARDHPMRSELEVMEREFAATDPPRTHCMVWKLNGEWRWSRDSNRGDMKYFDSVWADGIAWMLTDAALLIMDQADASSIPQRIDQQQGAMTADISLLLNAFVSSSIYYQLDLKPSLAGGVWALSARASTPSNSDVVMNARGRWNDGEGWGTVDECEYIETHSDGSISSTQVHASDWHRLPNGEGGIAGTVTHTIKSSQMSVVRTLKLVAVQEFTPEDFRAITEPPPLVGEDRVRGEVTYRQVQDSRGSALVVSDLDPSRKIVTKMTGPTNTPQKDRVLRQLGWALLAMIAVALLLIKINRASIGKRQSV